MESIEWGRNIWPCLFFFIFPAVNVKFIWLTNTALLPAWKCIMCYSSRLLLDCEVAAAAFWSENSADTSGCKADPTHMRHTGNGDAPKRLMGWGEGLRGESGCDLVLQESVAGPGKICWCSTLVIVPDPMPDRSLMIVSSAKGFYVCATISVFFLFFLSVGRNIWTVTDTFWWTIQEIGKGSVCVIDCNDYKALPDVGVCSKMTQTDVIGPHRVGSCSLSGYTDSMQGREPIVVVLFSYRLIWMEIDIEILTAFVQSICTNLGSSFLSGIPAHCRFSCRTVHS